MKLAALLACLGSAVLVGTAAAQEPPPPPPGPAAAPAGKRPPLFLGARLGVYRPGGDTNVLDTFDFGNGLDVEGFIGIPLNPYLSLVGGIGYYASSTDTLTAFDPQLGTASASFEVSAIPITASVRAGGTFDRVALYALAGVGYHMTSLEVKVGGDLGVGSLSEDDDEFGWHLGAGIALAVTPRLSLGAELRQTFVEGSYPNLIGDLTGGSDKLKLDGLHLGATLAFTL